MKLMRASKSEEVVFGKGFVPVFAASFIGTEEEIERLSNLRRSGREIHIVIDPTGAVTFGDEELHVSQPMAGLLGPATPLT
jgi:hypothetical protein